jgi:hypothetical protein
MLAHSPCDVSQLHGEAEPASVDPAKGSGCRGLRCVIVQVEPAAIKGAFGIETLDTHRLDQGRTQLRGSRGDV